MMQTSPSAAQRAERIDTQAAQWLLRQAAGLDRQAQDQFQQWWDADPAHRQAWIIMRRTDDVLGQLPAARVAALRRHASETEKPAPSAWRLWLAGAAHRTALAACAVIAAVGALAWFECPPDYRPTFATARGAYASRTLPDDSTIELDTVAALPLALPVRIVNHGKSALAEPR